MITKIENLIPKLLYLSIITTIVISTFSLSKFESAIAGTSDVGVATFVINASGNDNNLVIDCNSETPTSSYSVVVTNKKDSKVSGVSIKYDIVLEFNTALPSGMTISDGITTLDTTEDKTTYIFKNVGNFGAGVEKSNTHTITITGSNDVLNNYNDNMSIYVDATQID